MAIEFEVLGRVEILLPNPFDCSGPEGQEIMIGWENGDLELYFYGDGEPMKMIFPENTDMEERAAIFFDLYTRGKAKIFCRGGVHKTLKFGDSKEKNKLSPFLKNWFGKDA